jgi:hypothetical protein
MVGNCKGVHTLRVKPINKGVFSSICGDGGLFHDGIFGKSFLEVRLCPMGKLSSIGGYVFSCEKSLYLGSFVGAEVAVVSTTAGGGVSASSGGKSGGGRGFGSTPSAGKATLGGSELWVQRKNSENEMHSATKRIRVLQKRLGIIAEGLDGRKEYDFDRLKQRKRDS